MNFGIALQALKEGKRIRRSTWRGYWELWAEPILNADSVIGNGYKRSCQFDGLIVATLGDNKGVAPAQPYQSDMLSEDWEILD